MNVGPSVLNVGSFLACDGIVTGENLATSGVYELIVDVRLGVLDLRLDGGLRDLHCLNVVCFRLIKSIANNLCR